MKKLLLSLIAVTCFTMAEAQFTITSTAVTFTGNAVPSATNAGTWYSYQPGAGYSGSFFCDASCSTPISAANCTLGGWDPNVQDGSAQTSPIAGVVFWGGSLRSVYATYGTCVIQKPSFGFHTGTAAGGGTSGNALDLSSASNNSIQFTYRADESITIEVQLWNPADYTDKLSGATISLNGDGQPHTVTYDFSSKWVGGATKNDVKQVCFTIPQTTTTAATSRFVISNIYVGSSVANTSNASYLLSQNALYPNPASLEVNVDIELKETSNIKVVISDMSGKVMNTISNEGVNNFNKVINLANYKQGIYVVGYFLNETPVANKLLMVK